MVDTLSRRVDVIDTFQKPVDPRGQYRHGLRSSAALAELKSVGAAIPNQAVLIDGISPLEAQASNEFENIVTISDDHVALPYGTITNNI